MEFLNAFIYFAETYNIYIIYVCMCMYIYTSFELPVELFCVCGKTRFLCNSVQDVFS